MRMFKKRKKGVEVEEIDITSLLDILVILLVFLLKSFNDSDLTLDLVNELALPYSLSRAAANNGVIVQVNKKKNVFLNTDVVGNLNDPDTLSNLKALLLKKYSQIKSLQKEPKEKQLINLVFDKGLKYSVVDEVMRVSTDSGFSQYKLIIQGKE